MIVNTSRLAAASLALAALGAAVATPAQAHTAVGVTFSAPGISVSAGDGVYAYGAGYEPVYTGYPVYGQRYPERYPVYDHGPHRGWGHRHGWDRGGRFDRDHDGVPNRFDRAPFNPSRR